MADSVQALEVEEPDPLAYASEQRREGEDEPPAPRAALTHPPSPHRVAPCPPLVMAAKGPTPAQRPAPLQLNACFSFNSHRSGAEATLTLYCFMASYSLISSLFFQLYYIQAVLYGTSPARSMAWRSYMDTPVWSQIGTGIFLRSPVSAHEILLYGLYGYSTQPGGDNSDLAQSFLHCCNFNAIFLHCRGFWFNAAYKLRCY